MSARLSVGLQIKWEDIVDLVHEDNVGVILDVFRGRCTLQINDKEYEHGTNYPDFDDVENTMRGFRAFTKTLPSGDRYQFVITTEDSLVTETTASYNMDEYAVCLDPDEVLKRGTTVAGQLQWLNGCSKIVLLMGCSVHR